MTNTTPHPVPAARELPEDEIISVATELSVEADRKMRAAAQCHDTKRSEWLRADARALEAWAWRLTQALA